jgi:hypothetical protein
MARTSIQIYVRDHAGGNRHQMLMTSKEYYLGLFCEIVEDFGTRGCPIIVEIDE